MPAVFCSPLRYVQGPGIMQRLGREMEAVGLAGPVLVIAGNHAISACAPAWARAFDEVGWTHRVRLFGGESTEREIGEIIAEARSLDARAIVAAGGGKPIDAARAAAAELKMPFVSCPTVASTDAPTSALSVIYDENGAVKRYGIHRRNPDLVLVDTQVIAESPPRLLAAGIGDAASTFYEARAAVAAGAATMRGGRSTLAAIELARLCRDTVLAHGLAALDACRNRRCDAPLEAVVEAATLLSGLGFESSGLAAAHSIHNGLTALRETHAMLHGEKVAFGTLVQLVLERRHARSEQERFAAGEEAETLARFFIGCGLPVTLRELGVEADASTARIVAERAAAAGETIHNMPWPVDAAMVAEAILDADQTGRKLRGDAPVL